MNATKLALPGLFLSLVLIFSTPYSWAADAVYSPADQVETKNPSICESLLGRYVKFVDDKLAVDSSEWSLTAAAEDQINQILANEDQPDDEKFNQVIGVMLLDRASQSPSPRRQRWMKKAIEAAFNDARGDWYNRTLGKWVRSIGGPHFSLPLNRITVVDNTKEANPATAILSAHELTHAYDLKYQTVRWLIQGYFRGWNLRSIFLRNPLGAQLFNRMERSAIGGQWELVHRIPKQKREELIKSIEENMYGIKLPEDDFLFYGKMIKSGIYDRTQQIIEKLQAGGIIPAADFRLAKLWVPENRPAKDRPFDLSRLIYDGIHKLAEDSEKDHQRIKNRILSLISADDWLLLKLMINSRPGQSGRSELLKKVESISSVELSPEQTAKLETITQIVRESGASVIQTALDKIMIASLENADLPKSEFIKKLEIVHGYDLRSRLISDLVNPVSGLKLPLIIHTAYLYYTTGSLQATYARDVQFILWFLNIHQ